MSKLGHLQNNLDLTFTLGVTQGLTYNGANPSKGQVSLYNEMISVVCHQNDEMKGQRILKP